MDIEQKIQEQLKKGYSCSFCGNKNVEMKEVVNPAYPIVKVAEMKPDYLPTYAVYCKDCGHVEFFLDQRKVYSAFIN